MSGSLDQVLAAIAGLGERIGHMDERIGRLDERIGGVEKASTGLREDFIRLRTDLMARLDRQQDLLTAIKDDIGVNMIAVDRVRDANIETKKDYVQLADQVSLIHRRLMRLEDRFERRESGA